MMRLSRAVGYAVAAAALLRFLVPGSAVLAPWLPVAAVAVVGVAFGLERLKAETGVARHACTGLAAGALAFALCEAIYGAPWHGPVWHGLATALAAAVAVPLAGLALEAFPGPDRRAHVASGVVGLCALVPLGVYVLPWWLHPITHWNPLFWVHLALIRLHWTPGAIAASGLRMPATFEWEYTLVPFVEAALYGWLLTRRIRRLRASGA